MVRQAHHERNQYITVRPEPVEGLNQSFLNETKTARISRSIFPIPPVMVFFAMLPLIVLAAILILAVPGMVMVIAFI